MTGGGFGGCIVALTSAALAARAMQAVATQYRSPEGLLATSFLCHAAAGAGISEPPIGSADTVYASTP